jgi:hypothetical protein
MSATIEDVRQGFDRAISRLDRMAAQFDDHLAERHRREADEWRADDAERSRIERDQTYADAAACQSIRAAYSPFFEAFKVEPPAPSDNADPRRYERKLIARLARRLPEDHELKPGDHNWQSYSDDTFRGLAKLVLRAVVAEAERPSYGNTRIAPGKRDQMGFVMREKVGPMGERRTEFYGDSEADSFIRKLSIPGRRVTINDPRKAVTQARLANALWG